MKKYCVIGSPVAHSKSPELFADYDIEYTRNEIRTKEELEAFISDMRKGLWDGCNVTMPWKTEMVKLVDELSPVAELTGAVNTVANRNGYLYGDSTDGYGMCEAIGGEIGGKFILIIGSGGAARSIVAECSQRQAKAVVIIARDSANTQKMKAMTDKIIMGGGVTAFRYVDYNDEVSYSELLAEADIMINCTPIGMHGCGNDDAKPFPWDGKREVILPKRLIVAECIYNPQETPLLCFAEKCGCKTVRGLGMLKMQAEGSAKVFFR